MSLVNLSIFAEDEALQKEGSPIYPLEGESLFFCVPRAGGFLFQKQIKDIKRREYGVYHDESCVDMNLIHAIWLGEYVTDFGGVENKKTKEELLFNRANCRSIFNDRDFQLSLNVLLLIQASNFENYLTVEGREAIEELKKR